MKKNIVKIPVIAFFLGIGIIFSQSAFKPLDTTLYGKHETTSGVEWVDLTGYTEQTNPAAPLAPGQYRCSNNSSEICTGEFESQPEPEDEPENAISGNFDYNPM